MQQTEVTDYLTELSLNQLQLSLPRLLKVIGILDEIRVLLDPDHLYTQRCIGLARGTNKDDPLDCTFVLRAIREMLTTNQEDFYKVRNLIRTLDCELNG